MKKRIKEFEIEIGIIIKKPTGFISEGIPKNKVYSIKYNDRQFKRCAKNSEIICKTQKGLNFLMKRGDNNE